LAGAVWYTTQRRRGVPPWGTHGPGEVRCPYFFSLGWQVTRVPPYVRGPFPSREIRRISERDDPGPPVVPGRQGIGLDPETSREWIGDWGGPMTVWALLCVAERRATRPNREWGYSTRRHMLDPERPAAVLPDRALYLLSFGTTPLQGDTAAGHSWPSIGGEYYTPTREREREVD
jgi:hypothetical protein